MPLWGTEDTAAAKPQIGGRSQNAIKARDIFATVAGWSQAGAGRATTGKQHELLVAMRGLSTVLIGGTGAGDTGSATEVKASITSMNWNISSYSRAAGGTLSISANYNEAVTVTGNPTLAVNNDSRANHTLTYSAAASTANRMTFTLVIAAGHSSLQDGDVLSINGTNKISLSGGGVVGADGQAALITHAAGLPGNLEADA
ncbi:uncharacterized protein METZ01_LOCUS210245 [marine metagenome]|uniref:Uncharacterized protein n=1 Tax=marine metagenome TaxID=408172 RepID=A0A382F5K1_9ZZZZ